MVTAINLIDASLEAIRALQKAAAVARTVGKHDIADASLALVTTIQQSMVEIEGQMKTGHHDYLP